MPDENGICRCGGAGWDGCKPAKEAAPPPEVQGAARLDAHIERQRAAVRQTMAEIEAATAGRTLLDYREPRSLLASSPTEEFSPASAPLAITPPSRWPSAQLPTLTQNPRPKEKTDHVLEQR